ncbi:hypothetical protein, partial [Geodermatophilus chilensis]|uniref:hypothetical protein n=1 Tax=Geodermatophilus chilensis TaxID=2035835 RepID=UPI0018E46C65
MAAAAAVLALVPAAAASAHPLGNFTVNHHDGLVLTPDAVLLTAVIDRAEIPAAQALQEIAPDGPPAEDRLAEAAAAECAVLAREVRLTVDGAAVAWTVETTGMELPPGAANLPTMRLTCGLRAEVNLSAPATVAFRDEYLSGPVGWREITADGDGVRLLDSPVPVASPTDELRTYPEDLLASPLDVRSFEVATEPGENTAAGA